MQLAKFGLAMAPRQFVPQGLGRLGMIPSWQYSSDPGVNIMLNPNVKMPAGWTQTTVQPIDDSCCARPGSASLSGIFDNWAWTNRKWLVLGGTGLLGIAGLALAGALLR